MSTAPNRQREPLTAKPEGAYLCTPDTIRLLHKWLPVMTFLSARASPQDNVSCHASSDKKTKQQRIGERVECKQSRVFSRFLAVKGLTSPIPPGLLIRLTSHCKINFPHQARPCVLRDDNLAPKRINLKLTCRDPPRLTCLWKLSERAREQGSTEMG